MTDVAAALRELAGDCGRGDRIKVAIDRTTRRAGLSYWRAFDIWYGKARRIEQFEIDAIAEALDTKKNEETRRELHDLRTRLAVLEARLSQSDEAFHRVDIDVVRSQASGLRSVGYAAPKRA